MDNKPTHAELEHRIKQYKNIINNCLSTEEKVKNKQISTEVSHKRRTISLIKINEEQSKEINSFKSSTNDELKSISNKLRERNNELICLYKLSSLRASVSFSLDKVLQEVVEIIPPAICHPDIACARIRFDRYEFTTKGFKDTKWKFSQKIMVNNEWVGDLELCYLEERPQFGDTPFLEETKNLITAISDNIGQIIEREWAEVEIRKGLNIINNLRNKKQG